MSMLIPQLFIIQRQSPKEVVDEFNRWALERAKLIREIDVDDATDSLGIPSETHLQWDQGLQHYVMIVVYLSTEEEISLRNLPISRR